ncbi:uncharacterized protein [Ambystoma mexicanum]|uniref:uncharacterized protein isoform X2 n=1 Tax=Ambystoma mexicanum TaxID=8296 RepID=UPI0037E7EACD
MKWTLKLKCCGAAHVMKWGRGLAMVRFSNGNLDTAIFRKASYPVSGQHQVGACHPALVQSRSFQKTENLYKRTMTGEEEAFMPRGFGNVKPEILEFEIGQTSNAGNHWDSEDSESAEMPFSGNLLQSSRVGMEAGWNEVRRRSVNWSVEELEGLLNALGRSPHLGLLMSSKHMSTLHEWQTVENEMRQQGFCRSADQCRLKMKGIRRVFHHLRLGWVPGGKNTTALPHWFPRMMELWRQAGKPQFNTPLTKESNSKKNPNAKATQEPSKAVDLKHSEEIKRSLASRLEAGQPRAHHTLRMHPSGIVPSMRREYGLKNVLSSSQGRMQPHPCRTAPSHKRSQDALLEPGNQAPHSSRIPSCVPAHQPGSTRTQVQVPQSHNEHASSPVPRPCQASENNTALLKELNSRVQRLEDYHQRTNELLHQVVSILQTQSNLLQRSVN